MTYCVRLSRMPLLLLEIRCWRIADAIRIITRAEIDYDYDYDYDYDWEGIR